MKREGTGQRLGAEHSRQGEQPMRRLCHEAVSMEGRAGLAGLEGGQAAAEGGEVGQEDAGQSVQDLGGGSQEEPLKHFEQRSGGRTVTSLIFPPPSPPVEPLMTSSVLRVSATAFSTRNKAINALRNVLVAVFKKYNGVPVAAQR